MTPCNRCLPCTLQLAAEKGSYGKQQYGLGRGSKATYSSELSGRIKVLELNTHFADYMGIMGYLYVIQLHGRSQR